VITFSAVTNAFIRILSFWNEMFLFFICQLSQPAYKNVHWRL